MSAVRDVHARHRQAAGVVWPGGALDPTGVAGFKQRALYQVGVFLLIAQSTYIWKLETRYPGAEKPGQRAAKYFLTLLRAFAVILRRLHKRTGISRSVPHKTYSLSEKRKEKF